MATSDSDLTPPALQSPISGRSLREHSPKSLEGSPPQLSQIPPTITKVDTVNSAVRLGASPPAVHTHHTARPVAIQSPTTRAEHEISSAVPKAPTVQTESQLNPSALVAKTSDSNITVNQANDKSESNMAAINEENADKLKQMLYHRSYVLRTKLMIRYYLERRCNVLPAPAHDKVRKMKITKDIEPIEIVGIIIELCSSHSIGDVEKPKLERHAEILKLAAMKDRVVQFLEYYKKNNCKNHEYTSAQLETIAEISHLIDIHHEVITHTSISSRDAMRSAKKQTVQLLLSECQP